MENGKKILLICIFAALFFANCRDVKADSTGYETNYVKYVADAEYVLNVCDFGAIPNDGLDDTWAIQNASYCAKNHKGTSTIYVPSGEYNISIIGGYEQAIELYNDTNFIMETDTVLRLSGNSLGGYKILMVHESDNIRIIGGNIIGDRNIHQGTEGESGICIAIFSGYNIYVSDVNMCNSWGDGIFLGDDSFTRTGSNGVVIRNCHIFNNRRNNISICSGRDFLIDNCLIENANGTAPMSGIDIEPESNPYTQTFNEVIRKIVIKNTTINVVSQDLEHMALFSCWGWNAVSSDDVQILNCNLNGVVLNGATTNCKMMDTRISGMLYVYKNIEYCNLIYGRMVTNYGASLIPIDRDKVYSENCEGHSLSLNNYIGINYYMELGEQMKTEPGGYLHFECEGESLDVLLTEAVESSDGEYIFSYQVPAAKMTKKVTAQYILPGRDNRPEIKGDVHTYTVKEYTESILRNETDYEPELVGLVKAMLNYGGYAQRYFQYNTENPANQDVNGSDSLYVENTDPVKQELPDTGTDPEQELWNDELCFYGASLVCESETYLKLYFSLSDTCRGEDYEVRTSLSGIPQRMGVKTEDNLLVVVLYDIAPSELDQFFTFEIRNRNTESGLSFVYSPMTYIRKAQSNSDEKLVELTRAMYYYGQAAKNYFIHI